MLIDVVANPNCEGSEQFEFRELEPPRRIRAIRVGVEPNESLCEVVAVDAKGGFGPAHAVKIADSGSGCAFLIFGGEWGVRLRPEGGARGWDLNDRKQWGEPFKIYEERDIVYED